MIVQIFSMTSVADAVATALAGASLIGVVIAEAGVVPEGITPQLAREILIAVRPRARGVAMALSDDRDEICALVEAVRPDIVHLAAREIEPEDCLWIRERIEPVQLMRAITVHSEDSLAEADAHQGSVDFLMLDSGVKGAIGETHEWELCREIVARSRVPIILAGGLTPENVGQAISVVRPWGVDSFTHTDLADRRGKKDPLRVRRFVAAALRGFADNISQ
jgi:phosphoribosylanthranilate isomerase